MPRLRSAGPVAVLAAFLGLGALAPTDLFATSAVVGTGTPASCTEAAFDAGITAVNTGGGTLTFDCGAAPHVILVTVERPLTGEIVIDGGDRITLSGGLATRIFSVQDQSDVELRDIVLTHGRASAGPGGAVIVTGAGLPGETLLTLNRSAIRDSTTSNWGGGIAASNAEVQLLYSSVTGNEANGGGGGVNLNVGVLVLFEAEIADNRSGGNGGGIEFWTGELYMDRSVVDRNAAENSGTPPSGGGMSIRDLSVASIQASRFAGNWSRSSGGGLHVWGATELFLLQSSFSSNMVFEDVGGGLAILAPALVQARNLTVEGNRAGAGGGIEVTGALNLANATISNNLSVVEGGGALRNSGVVTLYHVTIAGNLAQNNGGGVHQFASGGIELTNVLFAGNMDLLGNPSDCFFQQAPSQFQFSLWPQATCGSSTANGNHPNTVVALPRLALSCAGPAGQEQTMTHDLPAGSAAVDSGTCILPGLAADQRGVARPQGVSCDIGAVERLASSCNGLFLDGFERGTTLAWSDSTR
jgi:hypothetical protein